MPGVEKEKGAAVSGSDAALMQYTQREKAALAEAAVAERQMHRCSNWRFAIFVATVAAVVWGTQSGQTLLALGSLVFGLVFFILVVIRHNQVTEARDRARRLASINREGILRCTNQWDQRTLTGVKFADRAHGYASDFDLFGSPSLFQWFNTARTDEGQATLAGYLLKPADAAEIPERQAAVQELAGRLEWRQYLELTAMSLEGKSQETFCKWGEDGTTDGGGAQWLAWLPVAVLGSSVFLWVVGLTQLAVLLVALQAGLSLVLAKPLQKHITKLLEWDAEVQASKLLVKSIEDETFDSVLLADARASMSSPARVTATRALTRLETVVNWLAIRHNPFLHIPLNLLFLWDVQWMRQVHHWREAHGRSVRSWLSTVARFEALSSLSVIRFEHPAWVFPRPGGEVPLQAAGLGHPLLPETARVTNDFSVTRWGTVALVTGSNMSGKSTFMRSVGVNLVLAGAGAPVCAASFEWLPVRLLTSMRIADDLRSGVSSFYAELLRIKMIVDAARSDGTPVMYLIDEIFRGTNSGDRIAGATAVLKSLGGGEAIGIVSTHDLELSKLADAEPGTFTNYHFTEHYTDNTIEFSYKILPGPSQTTNARHLIRMVGIDV